MSATIPHDNQLRFTEYPQFIPHYTPNEMLQLGVFSGNYFYSTVRRSVVNQDLFKGLDMTKFRGPEDEETNYFEIESAKTFKTHLGALAQYPGGWFTWYCKFYYNETVDSRFDNVVMIEYWQDVIKRFWYYCKLSSDIDEFPAERQALLEFGWDSLTAPTW
jgi:hypothetical protein